MPTRLHDRNTAAAFTELRQKRYSIKFDRNKVIAQCCDEMSEFAVAVYCVILIPAIVSLWRTRMMQNVLVETGSSGSHPSVMSPRGPREVTSSPTPPPYWPAFEKHLVLVFCLLPNIQRIFSVSKRLKPSAVFCFLLLFCWRLYVNRGLNDIMRRRKTLEKMLKQGPLNIYIQIKYYNNNCIYNNNDLKFLFKAFLLLLTSVQTALTL